MACAFVHGAVCKAVSQTMMSEETIVEERNAMNQPKAIQFSDAGQPAKINYQIPLPGSHTGRRIVELELGLRSNDFTSLAKTAGTSLSESVGLQAAGGNRYVVDQSKADMFLLEKSSELSVKIPSKTKNALLAASSDAEKKAGLTNIINTESFKEKLATGVVMMPTMTWAGRVRYKPRQVDAPVKPRIFVVEYYGVSSFLGDYGMGKTVKTFTLLPGETTTISLRTWQTTKESREDSSSIIDSHEQSAKERFADKIQNETTDKQTKSKTEEWHAEAEAEASWGWGSAKVSGGGGGQYGSSREQFEKQASESVKEHASEASSKREMSVSSSSERSEETGEESIIERTISNANMRRVLNFVFRELNQEYITKFHLKDIKIAFTNGRLNSWREVSISELQGFLEDFVVDRKISEVAQTILKIAGYVKDKDDNIVGTLEKVTLKNHGTEMEVSPGTINNNGVFSLPDQDNYYRFKRGPLKQDNQSNPVDGVLLSESNITMRTDSVIVEALLGQSDALDDFAMEIQKAAAEKETLANRREELLQESIKSMPDDSKRLDALVSLANGCCDENKPKLDE